MKKIIPLIIVLTLILCSCSQKQDSSETTLNAGDTESTSATAQENNPPVDVIRHPLNGEVLSEPYTGRVFSVSINNVEPAMPHIGVGDADVFFEMYVNDYCTRGLALYSDIKSVPKIGSIRSTRFNFTDIAKAYNSVMIYSGGSGVVLDDMYAVGIDNFPADSPISFRDPDRQAAGYSLEHTLVATGESLYNAAADKGFDLEITGRDYGMNFADEGTPANGSAANEIDISFTLNGVTKKTQMKYDAERDEYIYWQYGEAVTDENTDTEEGFRNVIIIHAPMLSDPVYHIADIFGMGSGYFACGGKMVPIKWWIESPEHAFTFMLEDGTPLLQEAGSTYIAIAPEGSAVTAK